MTTFSQLVDDMIDETRRPDMLPSIVAYLNQTLREVHFAPENNGAIMYKANFRERRLAANVDVGYGWEVPDSATFQAMQVVHYPAIEIYPPELTPSRGLQGKAYYYYQAGSTFFFAGYGGAQAVIDLGYYEFPRRLVYYPKSQRPAEFSPDIGWTYYGQFDDSEDMQSLAEAFTSNWLLTRWADVIAEGVRAKVYKRLSDTERARTCYSLYMSLRGGLYTSESASLGGYS